jgi:hypothetical protein
MAKPRRFTVCRLDDGGSLTPLFTSDDYERCDKVINRYWEKYPNAVVDIYEQKDLNPPA